MEEIRERGGGWVRFYISLSLFYIDTQTAARVRYDGGRAGGENRATNLFPASTGMVSMRPSSTPLDDTLHPRLNTPHSQSHKRRRPMK